MITLGFSSLKKDLLPIFSLKPEAIISGQMKFNIPEFSHIFIDPICTCVNSPFIYMGKPLDSSVSLGMIEISRIFAIKLIE